MWEALPRDGLVKWTSAPGHVEYVEFMGDGHLPKGWVCSCGSVHAQCLPVLIRGILASSWQDGDSSWKKTQTLIPKNWLGLVQSTCGLVSVNSAFQIENICQRTLYLY